MQEPGRERGPGQAVGVGCVDPDLDDVADGAIAWGLDMHGLQIGAAADELARTNATWGADEVGAEIAPGAETLPAAQTAPTAGVS